MNWEAIGAAAVVVTLMYLAGQVRQATRATQAASFQSASALEQEFLLTVGRDPPTARMWSTYMFGDPDTLSDDERKQCIFLMGSTIRRSENVYQQHQLGTISDEAWLSRQGMYATVARSRAYSALIKSPVKRFLGPEFIDFMDRLGAREPPRTEQKR